MRSLIEVVNAGSYTAAAERLGLTRAAVSKQVMTLERELGTRLLNRTTRRVAPTVAGLAYVERCQRILAEMAEADMEVTALQQQPRGLLRVNAPMSFGLLHLSAAVAAFMCRYPELEVHMVLNDRFVDLVDEGMDVALRIGALVDSSLIARRIGTSRRVLCAAPAYLARCGAPARPEDLSAHECLQYGYLASGNRWQLHGTGGVHAVAVSGRMTVNNGQAVVDAAVAGLGIALAPTFICGDALRDGRLLRVLPGWAPADIPITIVYPYTRRLSARVRVFVDFMHERFGGAQAWDDGID